MSIATLWIIFYTRNNPAFINRINKLRYSNATIYYYSGVKNKNTTATFNSMDGCLAKKPDINE